MTVHAARELEDGQVCLVGVGMPNAAANLARRLHAPSCVLVYESGAIGAKPVRLPLSIGDDDLAATADELVSVPEMFSYWIGAGRMDVGFLGAAQIDKRGNINTTVIGPYDHPKVRLPGAGGAPEIAAAAKEVIVMLLHSRRAFVERLDFVTSLGRDAFTVITDLGVLRPGLLAAHGVHVDAADRALLAARGVVVVLCPRSNEALDVGLAPVPELREAGVRLCLGTDSLASAPTLDLLEDMAVLRREFPDLPPAAIVHMGTAGGAAALGLDDLGTLAPGQKAALAFAPAASDPDDPLALLVSGEAQASLVAL